jgi:hypothetical protein
MRAFVILAVVALLALPAAALAQNQGDNPFGPLAPAPTPNPQPIVVPQDSNDSGSGDSERTTLFVIAGGLLITFIVIGRFIFRDARKHLPAESRARDTALRDEGPHRHAKHTKARARSKGKAQKAARRRNR